MPNVAPQLADAARALSWGLAAGIARLPEVIAWVDSRIAEVDNVSRAYSNTRLPA